MDKRLAEIASLEYDWNGYGADPFDKELVDKAQDVLNTLPVQPDLIVPTGRDSIQFEWRRENQDYLEFEIFDSCVGVLQVREQNYDDALNLDLTPEHYDRLPEILNRF